MATPKTPHSDHHVLILKTVLFKSPARIFCGECKKYIPSTMPWVCGFCDMEHPDPRVYSFLYKCKRCKKKPEAFTCPHCGTVWCFNRRADSTHPARKITSRASQPSVETPSDTRRREHSQKQEETRLKIEEAKLELQLKTLEERKKRTSPKSPKEQLEAELESALEAKVGGKEFVRKTRERIKKQFCDDAEAREDWLTALDDLARDLA